MSSGRNKKAKKNKNNQALVENEQPNDEKPEKGNINQYVQENRSQSKTQDTIAEGEITKQQVIGTLVEPFVEPQAQSKTKEAIDEPRSVQQVQKSKLQEKIQETKQIKAEGEIEKQEAIGTSVESFVEPQAQSKTVQHSKLQENIENNPSQICVDEKNIEEIQEPPFVQHYEVSQIPLNCKLSEDKTTIAHRNTNQLPQLSKIEQVVEAIVKDEDDQNIQVHQKIDEVNKQLAGDNQNQTKQIELLASTQHDNVPILPSEQTNIQPSKVQEQISPADPTNNLVVQPQKSQKVDTSANNQKSNISHNYTLSQSVIQLNKTIQEEYSQIKVSRPLKFQECLFTLAVSQQVSINESAEKIHVNHSKEVKKQVKQVEKQVQVSVSFQDLNVSIQRSNQLKEVVNPIIKVEPKQPKNDHLQIQVEIVNVEVKIAQIENVSHQIQQAQKQPIINEQAYQNLTKIQRISLKEVVISQPIQQFANPTIYVIVGQNIEVPQTIYSQKLPEISQQEQDNIQSCTKDQLVNKQSPKEQKERKDYFGSKLFIGLIVIIGAIGLFAIKRRGT